ncbi:hypothetical protein FH972_024622 [Carpinus fangiana]|uniref:TauD/TfdA-like domain-containing protein n=1 Tax=Carpinus fangiana TaxID=176857 RepID=A0A5N6KYY2_9ROSI|nr:hypothetical protein FH972_024622 [Carpinus fangiana]
MAPSLVEPAPQQAPSYKGPTDYKDSGAVAGGPSRFNAEAELHGVDGHHAAKYPAYLPTWDFQKNFPPLEDFEYVERGAGVDERYPVLLPSGAQVDGVTGNIGKEVRGVQLSKLNAQGRNELAHFVAKNRVVAFRDQDFADAPIGDAVEFVKYFGRLHVHPTSPAPAGFPEVHIVHRGAGDTNDSNFFADRLNSVAWHTDVSYERQPPGITFLYMLDGPSAGGDTIFGNMVEAYNRLSPEFKKRLHGLQAVHSGLEQASLASERGGHVRREAVTSTHPVVRTHPATGEKALYVNPQFTRRIVGFKKEESDMLLKFLFDHVALGQDFQARMKWAPGTVVVWDNRVTTHTAIVDWNNGERRHIARITPQAERPYETPFEEAK